MSCRNILMLVALCIGATSTESIAVERNETLYTTLKSELGNVSWNLDWSINRDYPILERGKAILDRPDLSLGSKLRLLTISHEVNGEFKVWVCGLNKVMIVTEPEEALDTDRCSRLNIELDKVFAWQK
mgnify:CR=1 FL=1